MNSSPRIGAIFLGAMLAIHSRGDITVFVGTHDLLPNTPGQTVPIYLAGGTPVSGVRLAAQVADGYPEVPGSHISGPRITDAILVGGDVAGVFAGRTSGQIDPGSGSQLVFRHASVDSAPALASGLLAVLTVDTTGIPEGTYSLSLGNVASGAATVFYDAAGQALAASLADGLLTVRPPQTFDGWRTAMPAPAGASGFRFDPSGDDDGDGISNLGEYAFGSDPLGAGTNGRCPHVRTEGDQIVIEYERPRLAVDLAYTVETTTDFLSWRPLAATDYQETHAPVDELTERVVLRLRATGQASEIEFVRVRADLR